MYFGTVDFQRLYSDLLHKHSLQKRFVTKNLDFLVFMFIQVTQNQARLPLKTRGLEMRQHKYRYNPKVFAQTGLYKQCIFRSDAAERSSVSEYTFLSLIQQF